MKTSNMPVPPSGSPIRNPALLARLSQCVDLPSPVGVVMRVLELGQDPEVSLGEVAKVINLDPALSAKMLRMANSPLYARQRKTENLRQAITLFGLEGTITLALGFSVVNNLSEKRNDHFDYPQFWRRSLAAATCAQVLSEQLALPNREDMFLAGLLQDIGMMALVRAIPELYHGVISTRLSHDRIRLGEREQLGVDHAEIGAWLLQKWNFPDNLHALVLYSHDPEAVDLTAWPLLEQQVRIIALSSEMADLWCNVDKESLLPALMKKAGATLGINDQSFVAVLESVSTAITEIAKLFEVELDERSNADLIINEARELILLRHIKVMQKSMMLEKAARILENRTIRLEEENRRDVLTGLFNHSYLKRALHDELELAKEHGWPLALIFIDLDRFKSINDDYGHLAGDHIIRETARLLRQHTRGSDIIARYGGEEFVVILPGSGHDSARRSCERLLDAFRTTRHHVNGVNELVVTASLGVAVHGESAYFRSIEDFLRAADAVLYEAKRQGRDRVIFHQPGHDVSRAAG